MLVLSLSCDPYFDVIIVNQSGQDVTLHMKTNINFYNVNDEPWVTHDSLDYDIVTVKIPDQDTLVCGGAIGSLTGKIPFDEILIDYGKKQLSFTDQDEIKQRFTVKQPYTFKIKKP